jgi:Sec-independent protein translocase protein TatA
MRAKSGETVLTAGCLGSRYAAAASPRWCTAKIARQESAKELRYGSRLDANSAGGFVDRPLFGRGKISEFMGDLAKGINSFKTGLAGDEKDDGRTIEHTADETVSTPTRRPALRQQTKASKAKRLRRMLRHQVDVR